MSYVTKSPENYGSAVFGESLENGKFLEKDRSSSGFKENDAILWQIVYFNLYPIN